MKNQGIVDSCDALLQMQDFFGDEIIIANYSSGYVIEVENESTATGALIR